MPSPMFGGTPDPMSMLLGIMGTPHGQDAAINIAGFLARPAKGTAVSAGFADPSVAPWLQPSIIPEKYKYPYGTPQKNIDDDKMRALGEQFLGFGGMMKAVAPMMGASRGVNEAVSALSPGIRAYHGSPHDFDKFSMSKIGTGEGAQAYGHGLYFAEKEGVARAYRDALQTEPFRIKQWVKPYLDMSDSEAISKLTTAAKNFEFRGDIRGARDYRQMAEWFRAGRPDEFNPGRMYEVNIRANPNEFLDWDKPLSQQAPGVQESLGKFGFRANPEGMRKFDDELLAQLNGAPMRPLPKQPHDPAGEFMYRNIPMATPRLRDEGIPGIRYLDQGSRAAGDGSRNYVLFRDDIIDILRKYGVFGAPPMFGKKPDEQ